MAVGLTISPAELFMGNKYGDMATRWAFDHEGENGWLQRFDIRKMSQAW